MRSDQKPTLGSVRQSFATNYALLLIFYQLNSLCVQSPLQFGKIDIYTTQSMTVVLTELNIHSPFHVARAPEKFCSAAMSPDASHSCEEITTDRDYKVVETDRSVPLVMYTELTYKLRGVGNDDLRASVQALWGVGTRYRPSK